MKVLRRFLDRKRHVVLFIVVSVGIISSLCVHSLHAEEVGELPQPDRYSVMLSNGGINYKSSFLESEKSFYKSILEKTQADILVLPFQVQTYAVDRSERYLMSGYLADYVRESSGQSVVDMGMLSRALGELSRTYSANDIYDIANAMGVQAIVWGFVGHNKDKKLVLTVAAQKRGGARSFRVLCR